MNHLAMEILRTALARDDHEFLHTACEELELDADSLCTEYEDVCRSIADLCPA